MTNKRGRKSKVDVITDNLEQIGKWIANGANEAQIAETLGLSVSTFEKYKNELPQLKEVLKKNRVKLVVDLKSALVKKALGFTAEEKKTYIKKDESGKESKYTEISERYFAPDVAALNSALQNFDGDWYRDKRMMELKEQELELRKELAKANLEDW